MIMLSCAKLGDPVNIPCSAPTAPAWTRLDGYSNVLPVSGTAGSGSARTLFRLPRKR